MNEEAIKSECRLYAIEWAVSKILALLARSSGEPAILEELRQQAVAGARQHVTRGVDPAMSDLLSAELEVAIDRILQMAIMSGGSNPKP